MSVKSATTVHKGNAILHRLVLQPGDTGVIRLDSTSIAPATVFAANHSAAGTGRALSLSTSLVDAEAFGIEFEPIKPALGVSETGEVQPLEALGCSLPSGVRTLHCAYSAYATAEAVVEVQE